MQVEEQIAPNLKETITAAVKEHTDSGTPKIEESKVKDQKETPKESTEDEKAAELVELENAKQLYKALKDPAQAPGIVEFIAKQAGYSKIETKVEAKEARKDITAILKDKLGDSFDFMTPQLAAAIKEYVSAEIEENQKDIRTKIEESEKEKVEGQVSRAVQKLTTSFFGDDAELPKEVDAGMKKYMDRISPTEDMSTSDYIADAFYSTIGRLGLTKVHKADINKTAKIINNRSDAASRLASDRGSTAVGKPVEDTSKIQTRRQAIQAAMEAFEKDN